MLLCHYGFSLYLVKRFGYLGAALATSCSGCITLFFGILAVWLVGAGPTIWGGRQGFLWVMEFSNGNSLKFRCCFWFVYITVPVFVSPKKPLLYLQDLYAYNIDPADRILIQFQIEFWCLDTEHFIHSFYSTEWFCIEHVYIYISPQFLKGFRATKHPNGQVHIPSDEASRC